MEMYNSVKSLVVIKCSLSLCSWEVIWMYYAAPSTSTAHLIKRNVKKMKEKNPLYC